MLKKFKLILLIGSIFIIQNYSQTIGEQKFLEMKNAFILGLTEKGFELGAELMSRKDYDDVREDATFYIAEFFFTLATLSEENSEYPSKAYTYYLVMQKEYPNSKYSTIVIKRINTLITFYQNSPLFRNLFDIEQNAASIVEKKLKFTETLFTFKFPNPYLVFLEGTDEVSSSDVLNRYYDEIIINLPEFEIYATYYKIVSKLSQYVGLDFLSDGLFKFKKDRIPLTPITSRFADRSASVETYDKSFVLKSSIDNDLLRLSNNYPHHPLTLQLHLILAKVFMQKINDVIDSETKKHLEFVIQNELDKTHPRYLLTREFILNNKFAK